MKPLLATVGNNWYGLRESSVFKGIGETSCNVCPVTNAVQMNLEVAITDDNAALGESTVLNAFCAQLHRTQPPHRPNMLSLQSDFSDLYSYDALHSLADISEATSRPYYVPTKYAKELLALIKHMEYSQIFQNKCFWCSVVREE